VLLGGGCVDRSLVEVPSDEGPTDNQIDNDLSKPLIADICDETSWEILPDSKNIDLSVAATPSGSTLLSVPAEGGAVRGFRLDQRGDLFDRDLITIRDDQNFTSVSAATTDGRLVVASKTPDRVALDLISDDLGSVHKLGEFAGHLIAETPVISTGTTRYAFVGGAEGLIAQGFVGGTWEAAQPIQLTTTPVTAMAAMPAFRDAVVMWSHADHTCHVQEMSTRTSTMQHYACDDVHLAIDDRNRATAVFTEDGGVFLASLEIKDGPHFSARQRLGDGSSPRAVFDGTRTWISYLDPHGTVTVGFLDDAGTFHSRGLTTTGAYELANTGNGTWVVGVDDAKFSATRVCARPQ
jgi:hypothetical protein